MREIQQGLEIHSMQLWSRGDIRRAGRGKSFPFTEELTIHSLTVRLTIVTTGEPWSGLCTTGP